MMDNKTNIEILQKTSVFDTSHSQDIIETLNAFPLIEEQYKIIEISAFQRFSYVTLVMKDNCKLVTKQLADAAQFLL